MTRSRVIRCPHCGANLAAGENHGPAFPPRERWRNFLRKVRERMHSDYLEILRCLRAIPIGQDFIVHDLGFRGGKGGTTVAPVIRAALEGRVVEWTGRRKVGPTSYGPKGPIGRPRFLVYRRLC